MRDLTDEDILFPRTRGGFDLARSFPDGAIAYEPLCFADPHDYAAWLWRNAERFAAKTGGDPDTARETARRLLAYLATPE